MDPPLTLALVPPTADWYLDRWLLHRRGPAQAPRDRHMFLWYCCGDPLEVYLRDPLHSRRMRMAWTILQTWQESAEGDTDDDDNYADMPSLMPTPSTDSLPSLIWPASTIPAQ